MKTYLYRASDLESTNSYTNSYQFSEICVFIIGFSFTVWTKMRPLLAH